MARRTDTVRRQLQAERDRLAAEIQGLTTTREALPPDLAEQAELAMEARSVARRRDHARMRLDQVEQAMARVEDGTFGRCETCGETIDHERLALVPTTTVCRTDAGLVARAV